MYFKCTAWTTTNEVVTVKSAVQYSIMKEIPLTNTNFQQKL